MTQDEWESLCDGCGKCCLHKLEDEDTNEVYYTNVACAYLDLTNCQCKDYSRRAINVPECVQLRPQDVTEFQWLPSTCAYRLVSEGKPLPAWHHLVSGNRQAIHDFGMSVRGRVIPEAEVPEVDVEDYIIRWVT